MEFAMLFVLQVLQKDKSEKNLLISIDNNQSFCYNVIV